MSYTAEKLIAIAAAEVGYIEKKSNSQLDDKTANAGSKNYTKYARDLYKAGYYNGNKQGYAYCDVGHDWCHWKAAGENKKEAERVTCQTGDLGAGCVFSARYYRNAGRFYSSPKIGDQIFFGSKGKETHTGIVEKVDSKKVYTIEFNTSGASGVVANGGGVFRKSYKLNDKKIVGYGRPRYDVSTVSETTKPETEKPTEPKTEEVSTVNIELKVLKPGMKGDDVKALQRMLHCMGYSLGIKPIDGSYGTKTEKAVKKYQAKMGLKQDGIVGEKTWKSLLGV